MHFVHIALQVGKLEVHGADCIHDPMVEAVGIVANALSAIAHPFEIIDALTDATLVPGRHDLLRGLAFLVELSMQLIKSLGIAESAWMVFDVSLTVRCRCEKRVWISLACSMVPPS